MTPTQQQSANLIFLALCVWRESRGESAEAQLAVAYSILQRVAKGGWWGDDVLSVVGHPWQYSSMTAPADPNLVKYPITGWPSWDACVTAAQSALDGSQPN